MQVWIASFILLFALAELFQWLKDFTLPLPIFILGGVFLAIASNSEKIPGLSSSFFPPEEEPLPPPPQPSRSISFEIRRTPESDSRGLTRR
ncbi:hypothetical protein H6G20_15925 [Desertifilum sp. FACHB-1129]|uniref:Uncharacterized protein n=1 Tax=Desertifilum tharense IPPAS B-1220 TaxID=1781255 RepID=A0A1E5QEH9_9CYAN|nr:MULTISPECIES: hypothetical protein [Desertifilum]MCD8485243.1 hypothetical protein [Desertifilum sp.]MDA0212612.1 hypothetical protein [Cyanobacteria bacterium FC1]MDI9638744.1 hypothetical protein [Geitlerinema splendidum]MBD2313157.1 hypothetical protein [Desertifilum sp. FACHB-1129]MBD2324037.1 hypothetical protein [Desertifilum sp. FACHB-866]